MSSSSCTCARPCHASGIPALHYIPRLDLPAKQESLALRAFYLQTNRGDGAAYLATTRSRATTPRPCARVTGQAGKPRDTNRPPSSLPVKTARSIPCGQGRSGWPQHHGRSPVNRLPGCRRRRTGGHCPGCCRSTLRVTLSRALTPLMWTCPAFGNHPNRSRGIRHRRGSQPSAQTPVQPPSDTRDAPCQVLPCSAHAGPPCGQRHVCPASCGERGSFQRRRPDSNRDRGFAVLCLPLGYGAKEKRGVVLDAAPPRVAQSGKPDSNRRPQPWQGCALPTELFPRNCTGQD